MDILGSGANDTLIGTADDDNINGFGGDDSLIGGDGGDALRGRPGNDTLVGGNGDDFLDGGIGDDVIDGGAGTDRAAFFSGATGGVTVDLNLQGQVQNTGQGMDTLVNIENVSGTAYGDVLTGDNNANWLWGSGDVGIVGNDTIFAGGGDDLVQVHQGDHRLDGGSGIDTLSFDNNGSAAVTAGVNVALWAQGGAQATGEGAMTITGFENLSGNTYDDTLAGDGGNNVLAGALGSDNIAGLGGDDLLLGDGRFGTGSTGNSGAIVLVQDFATANGLPGGNDSLLGGAGNDTLIGGGGDDQLSGGGDNDRIEGGEGYDALRGQAGADTLLGGNGGDFLDGGVGDDLIDGGDGYDRAAFFSSATAGVTVDLNLQGQAQNTGQGMDTLVNIENVSGTPYGDVLTGDDNANWLWGSGDVGIVGNDTISAGGGDDLVQVHLGDHLLDGGAGIDTLSFNGNGSAAIIAGVNVSLAAQGAAQATGEGSMTITGFENLSGYDFADTLTGDGGANLLAGALGSDSLDGGDGDDVLLGDGAVSTNNAGTGSSGPIATTTDVGAAIGVADGDDTLLGGNGADTLNGGGGDNQLSGGADADRIVLSTTAGHADTVSLGADADTLVLSATLQVGATATVSDFQTGAGGDAFSFDAFLQARSDWTAGTDPFANGYLRLVQDGSATRLELDTDGGAGPAGFVSLVTFQNTSALNFTAANLGGFAPAVSGSSGGDAVAYAPDAFVAPGGTAPTLDGGAGTDTLTITTPDPVSAVGPATITPSADGKYLLFDFNGDGTTDLKVTNVEDIVLNGQQVVISGDLAGTGLAPNTIHYTGTGVNDLLDASGLTSLESIRATGGSGNDTLIGANDDDTLQGGDGLDWLKGRGGPDLLEGGNGKDTLEGGAGDDTLRGGTGNDLLTGGDGLDRFEIEKGGGTDRITDFQSGTDRLVFVGGSGTVTWKLADLDGDGAKDDLLVSASGPGGLSIELINVSTLQSSDWLFA